MIRSKSLHSMAKLKHSKALHRIFNLLKLKCELSWQANVGKRDTYYEFSQQNRICIWLMNFFPTVITTRRLDSPSSEPREYI